MNAEKYIIRFVFQGFCVQASRLQGSRQNLQLLPHGPCTSSEDTDRGRKREETVFFGEVKVNVHCVSLHTQTIILCITSKSPFSASLENPLQAEPL